MKLYNGGNLFRTVGAFLFSCILFVSCRDIYNKDKTLTVTIPPVKYLVETITCGDFNVEIMLPEGTSPETFSPSYKDLIDAELSEIIFTTGLLGFEQEFIKRLRGQGKSGYIADLSESIKPIHCGGSCGEDDPHVWMSPKQLDIMAYNAYKAIKELYPDSVKYDSAYVALKSEIAAVSDYIENAVKESGKTHFVIYHPALAYYAEDYGLTQTALEDDGKEPSVSHLKKIIGDANKHGLTTLLFQKEFSDRGMESIIKDTGLVPVEINPLNENILDEIIFITNVIIQ